MVKRRTDSGLPKSEQPKGYIYICFQCAKDAELSEEHNANIAILKYGRCDNCGRQDQGRMSIETARYQTLLERANSGEPSEG